MERCRSVLEKCVPGPSPPFQSYEAFVRSHPLKITSGGLGSSVPRFRIFGRFRKSILRRFIGLVCLTTTAAQAGDFKASEPLWVDSGGDNLNRRVGFRLSIPELPENSILRIATSGLYRATVNGEFLGHGPARAGHGCFRIDEWPLRRFAGKGGACVVGIEVEASAAKSFYLIQQPPFLQVEVVSDGRTLATTRDFQAVDLHPVIVRKLPRYSYQRTFVEAFRPSPGWSAKWRTAPVWTEATMKTVPTPAVPLIERGVPYPDFKVIESKCIATGTFKVADKIAPRRYYGFLPTGFGDFPEEDMEMRPDQLMSSIQVLTLGEGKAGFSIGSGNFLIHDLGTNLTGFLGFRLRTSRTARLLATFDELRTGPLLSVNPHRMQCVNAIQIDLPAGVYDFETIEPYTLRYLQLHALEGDVTVEKCFLRELANPHAGSATFHCSDPRLDAIFEAARQTFRQNATDIFMDCPSRERAGWLCDSFFTARVERDLTGGSSVERNFLENYAQTGNFPDLADGMLPMCYPADIYQKNYIPNWAMWFVLELEEYGARGGDQALIDRLRPRVEALLAFFKGYQNSDGLLEKLDKWVFVEWSDANKFVQDVNYPTNMLYAATLDAAGRIYRNEEWRQQAATLRETINRQSFDGTFYRDHAKRLADGSLKVQPETTEVCQYYAFFFETASPSTRPELWKTLVQDFGPLRRETKVHPKVSPCNQLPGNMLRIEVLSRYVETARIHDEAIGYWNKMAETTGTLWEHDKPQASCNHGFASHAAVVLRRDILGLREIDCRAKTVSFSMPANPLRECRGSFPTADGEIVVEWKRNGGEPKLTLPPGWQRTKP